MATNKPQRPPKLTPAEISRSYIRRPGDIANALAERIERSHAEGFRLIQFGVRELDNDLTIYPGSVTALVGRPGAGKSMIAKALAKLEVGRIHRDGTAEEECVVYVTLEEPEEKLALQIGQLSFGWREAMRGELGDADAARLEAMTAVERLMPFWVIRQGGLVNGRFLPPLTTAQVMSSVEQIATDHGRRPTLIILDYLQLLHGDNRGSAQGKTEQVMAASNGAVRLARTLQCPVIMAVQASRETDTRKPPIPRLQDGQWACLTGDARIALANGEIAPLKQVHDRVTRGERIEVHSLGDGGFEAQPIVAAAKNPPRACLRISTEGGLEVTATGNHPILTDDGWVAAEDLGVGDYVATAAEMPLPDGDDRRINPDRAYVLGLLIGDGCVVRSAVLTNGCPKIRGRYRDLVERAWPGHTAIFNRQSNGTSYDAVAVRGDGRVYPGCNDVINWLRDIGLFGSVAATKRVPSLRMGRESTAALLAGLIQTDGSPSRDRSTIVYSSVSSALLADIQGLSLRFGAWGTIRQPVDGCALISWTGPSARWLAQAIHPYMVGAKARRVLRICGELGNGRGIEYRLPPSYCYMAIDAAAGHREEFNMVKGRAITRERMLRVARHAERGDLAAIANQPVVWARVLGIEPVGEHVTYDIQVARTENFVANGMVVHNSSIEQDVDIAIGLCRPIATPDIQEKIAQDGKAYVDLSNGRSVSVTKSLMLVQPSKARDDGHAGKRYAIHVDPETLDIHGIDWGHGE